MEIKENPSFVKEFEVFFSQDENPSGSKKRVLSLLEKIPQFSKGKINYLIAGSWATEILSKKEIEHDDIDIITLTNPSYYLDDATEDEEKCFSVFPLEEEYLECNFLKKSFENKVVYVSNYNLQICSKLIGQLQEKLPERAIEQLKFLLGSYPSFNKEYSQKEILYILEKLTPDELNHKVISKHIVDATELYLNGEKEKSLEEFLRIHSLINKVLRYQFEKRGLSKKIKISEK